MVKFQCINLVTLKYEETYKAGYVYDEFEKNMALPTIQQFLSFFEEVDLPLVLTEEVTHTFDRHAKPLPAQLIEAYIVVADEGSIDEFTEYIPCFKLPIEDDYFAVVYLKAGLLSYAYHLVTYSEKGEVIDHANLGGIESKGNLIRRSVTQISADLIISILQGVADKEEKVYDSSKSTATYYELLPNGVLVRSE